MYRSISNNLGLFIIFLFAISPVMAFFTYTFVHKAYSPFLVLLCIPSIYLILYERGTLSISLYTGFFILFFIYTLLSDVFIVETRIGASYIRNNLILGSALILIIIESLKIPDDYFLLIKKISKALLFLAFFVIIIQQFFNPTFLIPDIVQHFYLTADFNDTRFPSIYGYMGGFLIGLCFFPILGIFIEDSLINKKPDYRILFFIGLVVALLNKSRFLLLNFLILFILIPIHKGFNALNLIKYSILVLFVSISMYYGAKIVHYDIDTFINERLLEKSSGGMLQGSAGTRILAFEVFGKLFPENPVFGKGKFHSFGRGEFASKDIKLMRILHGRSSQLHVGYLSLFYYYGIFGGSIYILFLFFLTRRLYIDAKLIQRWSLFIGWIMFMVSNLTLVSLDIFNMGVILVIFFNNYYKSSVPKHVN